jgi:phage terminase small subunit
MMTAKKTGRGGARQGAGRPAKLSYPLDGALNNTTYADPLAFLNAAMNDPKLQFRLRVDAAKAMLAYMHPKIGEGGKKEKAKDAAAKAASGKFTMVRPPSLKLIND